MGNLLGIAWENIFIGLLGGFIVSGISILKTFIQNKLLERKFPIKGRYLTKFEDIVDGKKVETSALAILNQRGSEVSGKTWLDDRCWIINGKITQNGSIHGVYTAESPWDKGIGNFFLSIDNNRNMVGLWSGYDSANDIINSGKYIFKPIISDFSIVNMKPEHFSQAIDISDSELGKDYLTIKDLEDFNNQENYNCCKTIVIGDTVVGFCLSKILNKEQLISFLKIDEKKLPTYISYVDKTWLIKTIVIDSKYHGKGIGYQLMKEVEKEISQSNVRAVCSVLWKNGESVNAHGIISSIGLKKHVEIEEYWKQDSIEQQFTCSCCGEPPCLCSALLYFKPR